MDRIHSSGSSLWGVKRECCGKPLKVYSQKQKMVPEISLSKLWHEGVSVFNLRNLFIGSMSDKIEQQAKIKAIQAGAKDHSGNTITQVLASGDEYAIYEIDHPDIGERLRVTIEGSTNEREHELAERFNRVNQKYLEAKGLLYRSVNLGVMKTRVAHVLSAVLSSDKDDGNKDFEELIHKINEEYRQVAVSRLFYLLPTILSTIVLSMQAFYLVWSNQRGVPLWPVIYVLLGSCLGGSLSIFSGLKKYKFGHW